MSAFMVRLNTEDLIERGPQASIDELSIGGYQPFYEHRL